MRRFWIILLGCVAIPLSVHAAEIMYVKSPTAKLRSGQKSTSPVIAKLRKGTKVDILRKQGLWYQVAASGSRGWIYRFKLSKKKPASRRGSLAGLGGGGATAREGSTATSIRGLSPTSERYAERAQIGRQHINMVKHMESLQVPPAEVEKFLKEGRLGEYSGTP